MKQPLWIINCLLLLFLVIIGAYAMLTRQKTPIRQPLVPDRDQLAMTVERPVINTKRIYENDLFDTYVVIQSTKPVLDIPLEIPPTPVLQQPMVPAPVTPDFAPPLNITLKGIMIMSADEDASRAIIIDNQTGQESVYKVGDAVNDGRLIRILANKVIIVRGNGQQEVLYLREKDAKNDPTFAWTGGWNDVITEIRPFEYALDPRLFLQRVTSLAKLIDMLDLTVVYKRGKNSGCRIGSIEKDSLGSALGLETGDVITAINGVPATDIKHRLKIYRMLTENAREGTIIRIDVLRHKGPMTIRIIIEEKKPKPTLDNIKQLTTAEVITKDSVQEKELQALRDKYKFAPTLKEIRERERERAVRQRN